MTTLQILTLNCWGVPVPGACKMRSQRMEAIGDALAKSDYHIVVMQEMWKKADYERLKNRLSETMKYSHYFYSGMIGSGLCVFSRVPVLESMYFKFDPNGYAHKIHHGDFYGGKGVGLAVLKLDGFTIHLYDTHIHAEYNRENDEYLAHRVSQAFQASQFIRHTSTQADLTLLCGDLNLEPVDLGYKIIRTNANLHDSWIDKKSSQSGQTGNTCDCPQNSFASKKSLQVNPEGKRIDYILYKQGQETVVEVRECSVTMGRVPKQSFSFSDHEGVEAKIHIRRRTESDPRSVRATKELCPLIQEAICILDRGLEMTKTNQKFFLLFAVFCFLLSYAITVVPVPFPLEYVIAVFQVVLTVSMGYGIIQNLILIRSEVHGLTTTREDMKNYLQNLQRA